jgi:hypothetical protein
MIFECLRVVYRAPLGTDKPRSIALAAAQECAFGFLDPQAANIVIRAQHLRAAASRF